MELTPLGSEFFEPSAAVVAPLLLGHWLVRKTSRGWCGGIVVETEAYLADDPACHGYRRETPRNRSMFGPPGHAYVYFIYGNHYCFNAVCRSAGVAEAVLVRALEPALREDWMAKRRLVGRRVELTSGPAKLCQALEINRRHDGVDLGNPKSSVWMARNPESESFRASRGPVRTTTRIGLSRAAELPLRYYLTGSEFVSRRAILEQRRQGGPEG